MNYYYINSNCENTVSKMLKSIASEKHYSIDIETTGLNPRKDKLCVFTIGIYNAIYIIHLSLMENEKDVLDSIMDIINQNGKMWILHNAKFDIQFLLSKGYVINSVTLFDTMVAESLLLQGNAKGKLTLQAVVKKYLDITLNKEEQCSDWMTELSEHQIEYVVKDVCYLSDVMNAQIMETEKYPSDVYKMLHIENNAILPLACMEYNGIMYDTDKAIVLKDKLSRELTIQFGKFEEQGVNLNSPVQLKKYLHGNGIYVNSTDKDELVKYKKYPLVVEVLKYKKLIKLIQNIDSMLSVVDSSSQRIYATYFQNLTSTGRITCAKPNLQGIPHGQEIRSLFRAPKGKKFVIGDYSQMELRIMAVVANEEKMIQAYVDERDLHTTTASLINEVAYDEVTSEQRKMAKAFNFGLIYGMWVRTFIRYARTNYDVELSEGKASSYIAKFFEEYPAIYNRIQEMKYKQEDFECSLGGRCRTWSSFPDFKVRCNYTVQATGADILKLALDYVYNRIILPGYGILVLSVHDEIVLEVEEEKANEVAKLLKCCMEEAGDVFLQKRVPVVVDVSVGNDWSAK